jgi:hypothetical protein
MRRLTMNRARAKTLELCPTACEVGFGPVGHLVWHVFDKTDNATLGRGLSKKGAWCRALARLERQYVELKYQKEPRA